MTAVIPESKADFQSHRDLTYIKPRGRRLSEYEAVACYAHVDMDSGYEAAGWSFRGMDGREPVTRTNTRLLHPDWYEYRDPSKLWQRPYIRHQTSQEHNIQAAMDGAAREGAYAEIDPAWSAILAAYYEGFAFLEWGISRAYFSVVREARCDTLTMAYGFTSMDHMRHQQAIALYCLDLDGKAPGFKEGLGRACWLEDPVYRSAKRVVEELIDCRDWAEVVVVTNLLLDPLLSNLAVSKFFRRFAPLHGDLVTPVISMTAENDRVRNLAGAVEFVKMMTVEQDREGRPVPGGQNRATIQGWIDHWASPILAAVDAFMPVFDLPPVRPVTAEAARDAVVAECRDLLAELDLTLPAMEVTR